MNLPTSGIEMWFMVCVVCMCVSHVDNVTSFISWLTRHVSLKQTNQASLCLILYLKKNTPKFNKITFYHEYVIQPDCLNRRWLNNLILLPESWASNDNILYGYSPLWRSDSYVLSNYFCFLVNSISRNAVEVVWWRGLSSNLVLHHSRLSINTEPKNPREFVTFEYQSGGDSNSATITIMSHCLYIYFDKKYALIL